MKRWWPLRFSVRARGRKAFVTLLKSSLSGFRKVKTRIPSANEGRKPTDTLHSHDLTTNNFSPNKNIQGEGGSKKFSPLFVSQRGVWRNHVPPLFTYVLSQPPSKYVYCCTWITAHQQHIGIYSPHRLYAVVWVLLLIILGI